MNRKFCLRFRFTIYDLFKIETTSNEFKNNNRKYLTHNNVYKIKMYTFQLQCCPAHTFFFSSLFMRNASKRRRKIKSFNSHKWLNAVQAKCLNEKLMLKNKLIICLFVFRKRGKDKTKQNKK